MRKIKELVSTKVLTKRDLGGSEIIVAAGLVIIGVVLLAIFKTNLTTIITNALTGVGTAVTALFG